MLTILNIYEGTSQIAQENILLGIFSVSRMDRVLGTPLVTVMMCLLAWHGIAVVVIDGITYRQCFCESKHSQPQSTVR